MKAYRLFGLGVLLLCLLRSLPSFAHEIGETRVFLHIDGNAWSADIVTAPTPLLNRLELQDGQRPSRGLDQADLQNRLAALMPRMAEHVTVTFDGVAVALRATLADLQMPADPLLPVQATVRLEGMVPVEAQTLQWRFDLPTSRYALSFNGEIHWLDADQPSPQLALTASPPPDTATIFAEYLRLGFTHILPAGPDHVLFVLGLVLAARTLRQLATQVTAFTLAHSLTLFLATEGLIHISSAVVEPLIALSIAIVGVENMLPTLRGRPPGLPRWRPVLVFCFGLLHGMGFAGVLSELGLPAGQQLPALLAFNIGIELAQLAIVLVVHGLVLRPMLDKPWYGRRVTLPASAVVACIGLYWALTRALGS